MNEPKVLLIDDDAEYSAVIAQRCRALGVAAKTAKNPLTAMAIAERWRPDVVCFDVQMPTGNGLDVCAFLAGDSAVAGATYVVLTGRTDRDTIRRCSELGAHYVFKSAQAWRQLRDVLCRTFPELQSAAKSGG